MTQEDIIRMAVTCQLITTASRDGVYMKALERFATVVAAAEREACLDAMMQSVSKGIDTAIALEREACAKVCESYLSESPHSWGGTTMAAAIRARGQA